MPSQSDRYERLTRWPSILKPLTSDVLDNNRPSLQHLRRLVTVPHLPQLLREQQSITSRSYSTIFLLLPTAPALTEPAIASLLAPHLLDFPNLPRIFNTRVPLHPPTSAEQANYWSKDLWPCTYNPASQTLQHAPPLNLLRATQAELDTDLVAAYMRLARLVGQECDSGGPERIGAVIVDPTRNEVIAAAGDARRFGLESQEDGQGSLKPANGRPEHHALMRVIATVASKELRRRDRENLPHLVQSRPGELNGSPLTAVEKRYFAAPEQEIEESPEEFSWLPKPQSTPRPDSYLCSGLDVYLTHEPCICCAMAMIHSRFRACIFAQKMPLTGALVAETDEGSLGYGLFWRKELNWRVMAFQYLPGSNLEEEVVKDGSLHA